MPYVPSDRQMEYPWAFPPDLLTHVENERTSSELQLRDAVSNGENVLEEARRFVERVFLAFARQACEAERRAFWTPVDARPAVDWFLNDQLIPEAYRLAYPGPTNPPLHLKEFRESVNEKGAHWTSYLKIRRDQLAGASSPRNQPEDDSHSLGIDARKHGEKTETSGARAVTEEALPASAQPKTTTAPWEASTAESASSDIRDRLAPPDQPRDIPLNRQGPQPPIIEPLLSVQKAAKILGVHEDTIRRMQDNGKIELVRIGTRRRVRRSDVQRLINTEDYPKRRAETPQKGRKARLSAANR
jgi:excisionase family DNA binding protein